MPLRQARWNKTTGKAGDELLGAYVIGFKLTVLAIVVLIVGATLIDLRLVHGKYRPFADRLARDRKRRPLGMEATDEAKVAGILQRNSALARNTGSDRANSTWIEAGAIALPPYAEDETYAVRYSDTQEERK